VPALQHASHVASLTDTTHYVTRIKPEGLSSRIDAVELAIDEAGADPARPHHKGLRSAGAVFP
jgi:hypothetical protein